MRFRFGRCFAAIAIHLTRIAVRFASIAIPLLRAAIAPLRRTHAEVAAERARKAGGRREAVALRNLEHAGLVEQRERARGALDPNPTDENRKSLARNTHENPMKMERRERGDRRKPFQGQFVGKVSLNVVDDAIDAPLILTSMR